jgi:hypothetical protein
VLPSAELSASDYYEFATGANPTFGYVQFGSAFAVPLGFLPKSFGPWVVKGGAGGVGPRRHARDAE